MPTFTLDGAVEPKPFVDPRSRPAYLLCAAGLTIEAVSVLIGGFTASAGGYTTIAISALWMVGSGMIARRYGHPKVATALEVIGVPILIGALVAVATFMTTAISGPFTDHWLSSADIALGFDWLALFKLYQANPLLIASSRAVYTSLTAQIAVVPLLLVLVGQSARVWTFLTAYLVAGIATAIIHPFFPAVGPFVYNGIRPEDIPTLYREFPWATGPIIEAVQSGQLRDVTVPTGGLVSFPSFHAAAAVLLGWAAMGIRRFGFGLVGLNVAMWLSTLISGAHYLVDLLAGTVVAVVSITIAHCLRRPDAPLGGSAARHS